MVIVPNSHPVQGGDMEYLTATTDPDDPGLSRISLLPGDTACASCVRRVPLEAAAPHGGYYLPLADRPGLARWVPYREPGHA